MRKIILLAAACFLLQISFAENNLPSPSVYQTYLIVQPKITITSFKPIQKRIPLKERLLMKWYKKKMLRTISEEKEKKNIKNLSSVSLILSVLSVIAVTLAYMTWQVALIYIGSLFFLIAIITSLIVFAKWKNLSDKSGINKLGLRFKVALPWILGIGFLIFYLLS